MKLWQKILAAIGIAVVGKFLLGLVLVGLMYLGPRGEGGLIWMIYLGYGYFIAMGAGAIAIVCWFFYSAGASKARPKRMRKAA